MDLGTAATLVSTLAVVAGVVFALLQVKQLDRRRKEQYTMEVLRGMQAPEVRRAAQLVWDLPDGLTAEQLCARPGAEEAFLTLATMFETIGYMVHRRLVSLDMVVDVLGGVLLVHWTKGERYLLDVRAEGHPRFFEWFHWLKLQVERRYRERPPTPAHVAFADEVRG